MTESRVGITGIGSVTALGTGVAAFEMGLRAGQSGVVALAPDEMSEIATLRIGAPCRSFDADAWLASADAPAATVELLRAQPESRALAVTAASVSEAARGARLEARTHDASRTAMVTGGSNFHMLEAVENTARFARNPAFVRPRYGYQFFDSHVASLLGAMLGARGPCLTVSGAAASGLYAVIVAADLIRCGRADIAVAVGPMAALSLVEWQALHAMGALASASAECGPEALCRPFDAEAAGFVPGEGAGAVVLESVSHADRRGVPILAELAGSAMVSDGNPLPNPDADGEHRVMQQALAQAGVSASAVRYINAHATSTQAGDGAEAEAIQRLTGGGPESAWVNATKGLIGHTLFASGTLALIATVLQMRGGFIHPNRNLDHPIAPDMRFAGAASFPIRFEYGLTNAFGFGGLNASVLVRSCQGGR